MALAAQTLSDSVAKALQFLNQLGISKFEDVSATVHFIMKIDQAFDALNVRRPGGQGYKTALSRDTIDHFENFVSDCVEFLLSLKTIDGDSIIHSRKSTGFLSFIFCLTSLKNLAKLLFTSSSLKYVLSYKLSQDHLELFFNCVRRSCGWNNNPTALQFSRIFKRLLKHAGVEASSRGNCLNFENELSDSPFLTNDSPLDSIVESMDFSDLSRFASNVSAYIAGHVIRRMVPRMNCDSCKASLISLNVSDVDACDRHFLSLKNNGGIVIPSQSAIKLIKIAELTFKEMRCSKAFNDRNLFSVIFQAVHEKNVFRDDHFNESDHLYDLVLTLSSQYLDLRAHHQSDCLNNATFSKRYKLNKFVLFNSM